MNDLAVGSKVKGITIKFEGDTTELGKALKDINSKAKTVESQLRSVNKSLKFNPKNTELLAQKQQLLGQKVEQTKNKLTALRQAQAKLDDDPSVDKTSQEYMELRREIIETESKLKHFETQLKEMDKIKFEQVGQQFKDVGGKMQTVGTAMTKYVTGPIVAGAGLAVKAWQEVDEGLDIVTQKTGASGKTLEGMQRSVKNLAQQIPTDFATAGAAVGEVNTRFGVTGKELETLSGKFIKFAQLNDTDVSTSVDKVQKAMEAFGVPAAEAGSMLDVLNKVGQDTGISMDTLTDAMVKNAPQLQAMGLTANQAATFLGQLEVSGIDSSKAMTGLNKAIVNGAKEGKTLPEVMTDIQNSIVGAASETDAMNAAVEIFGSKAGPAIATAARNGSLDFQALASSVTDAEGSLEKTFNETLDPADKFQMILNSLKITGYEVADSLFTLLAPAIDKIAGALKTMASAWSNLSPETQKIILTIAGIIAAIGPLLIIFGKIATGIGAIIQVLPMLGGAFSALAGPVGIVIAIIGALIAIGVLLYKNWDTIKKYAGIVWNGIVKAVKAAGTGIKNAISTWFKIITAPFRAAWNLIKTIAQKIKDVFNFKFKLPKIKLPHFAIDPPGWQLGDLLQGSIPHLGIDWYAKGGIFKSPAVIGVGDVRGGEAVLPIEKLNGMLMAMADNIVNGVATTMALQAAGNGGPVVIENYLYKNGPQLGETIVKEYDRYKKILG